MPPTPSKPSAPQKSKSPSQLQSQRTAGTSQTASQPQPKPLPAIPLSKQQSLLTTFKSAFPNLLNPNTARETLPPILQEIKSHLYNRDFNAAFSKQEYLEAYAARWSAARCLAYLPIFQEVIHLLPQGKLAPAAAADAESSARPPGADKYLNILTLGGGAGAEVVALAGLHDLLTATSSTSTSDTNTKTIRDFSVRSVDIAEWESTLRTLQSAIHAPPTQLIPPSSLALNIHTFNALDPSSKRFLQALVSMTDIITVMFTLNELYTTSIAATQTLLLDITRWTKTRKGVLLCVVDSPGSYSEVAVGARDKGDAESTQRKKYPMHWLLDHALLHSAKELEPTEEPSGGPWDKLVSEESRWFRLPDGLDYPIDLENMRFQMHVYRRV